MNSMRTQPRLALGTMQTIALAMVCASSACITLKSEHDDLAREVTKLRKELAETRRQTVELREQGEQQRQVRAATSDTPAVSPEWVARIGAAETSADQAQQAANAADVLATAAQADVNELRADLDTRLVVLETRLKEAGDIPGEKDALWAQASTAFRDKQYKQARKLWHVYRSRFPDDARAPEASFNVGLTHYSERDYNSALAEFYTLARGTAVTTVLPDTLYYAGLSFAKLGQCNNAIAMFRRLQDPVTHAPERHRERAAEQVGILERDEGNLCRRTPRKTAS